MGREFASKVVWVWDDFIDAYEVVEKVPFTWDGEVAELKKGREAQQQVTQQSLANAATNTGRQGEQYGKENTDIGQLEKPGPGGLSDASSARYAADLENIGKTYGGLRQAGYKTLAQRGLGNAPTGAESSLINSNARAQGEDETKAFENAQLMTREDQLAAMRAREGLQGIYNPNAPLQTAGQSAYEQSQMGSTLGDIGSGIMTAASIPSTIMGFKGLSRASGTRSPSSYPATPTG